jgi:cysteine desulfurase family protein (TIGR01976 family)
VTRPLFPIQAIRAQFPALQRDPRFIFFDNAAGAQIPARVLAAVTDHLVARNVQRGGIYRHSREVDAMIARTRESVAALVNATEPDEIAFGLNATSFIRAISLAVGQTLKPRNEIVVSDLDHEANVATWLALERFGARIVWWPVRNDGRLYVNDLEELVTERTRLVACTMASNATGTRVDVAAAAAVAHRMGAEIFLDAVHFGPHGPIDVQSIGADYLVCSGYKLFSPHMGFAWCRRQAINPLPTFREDFIPDVTPDKLEAGTYAYENVAGMNAVVDYLEDLGGRVTNGKGGTRRERLHAALSAIAAYEHGLSVGLLDAVTRVPGVSVHGITHGDEIDRRVPTIAFTVARIEPAAIAEACATRDVGVRSGHMYSPRLMRRLGTLPSGVVRASLVHYNTADEITQFGSILEEVCAATSAPAGGRSTTSRERAVPDSRTVRPSRARTRK